MTAPDWSSEETNASDHEDRIAIVGMAGRFPGAPDVDALWDLTRDGRSGIVPVGPSGRAGGWYGVLPDSDRFDAQFFRVPEHEAALIDPQQRVLLEVVQHAIESSGVDPTHPDTVTAVYASATPNQATNPATTPAARYEWDLANGIDFVASRLSYRLELRGEAVTVQTACSSSLVGVHLAVQSLLSGQCDAAIACGVSISPDQTGYLVEEGMIASPTGACRPFDDDADGTVPGAGVAAVVLKRLPDALRDGDRIRAVIIGSAANNDGGTKVGFMAPSPTGQAEVIAAAHAVAGIGARSVGYVETHGTATPLGDRIEIEGLRRAFALDPAAGEPCAIGSLKANCGHLDRAAGVAGLIRAVLAVEHAIIPPMAGHTGPDPDLDLPGAGFYIPVTPGRWPAGPRRAGVSAFGVGGTNVHVLLEQAPDPDPDARGVASPTAPDLWLLGASAPDEVSNLAAELLARARPPGPDSAADIAAALAGRRPQRWRSSVVLDPAVLDPAAPGLVVPPASSAVSDPSVVFVFPGQGDPTVDGMPDLYAMRPVFREVMNRCAEIVAELAGFDLLDDLYAPRSPAEQAALHIDMARFQPALFAVEWSLVALWRSWGVVPQAVAGHSVGEVTAAACAGVMSERDALALVVERSRLLESTELGATLTVGLSAGDVREFLRDGIELASDNGAELVAVTGPVVAVDRLEVVLGDRGVFRRRLNIRHSPHGSRVAHVADRLAGVLGGAEMASPDIPMTSNVSGDWAGVEIAEPGYWSRQLRTTVRFREQLDRHAATPGSVILVVGPGAGFARMVGHELAGRVPAVVHAYESPVDDTARTGADWLAAAGRAWSAGAELDTRAVCPPTGRRSVLPPTRFHHARRWPRQETRPAAMSGSTPAAERLPDPGAWLTVPVWAPVRHGDHRSALRVVLSGDRERDAALERLAAAVAGPNRLLTRVSANGTNSIIDAADLLWWLPDGSSALREAAALARRLPAAGRVTVWLLHEEAERIGHAAGGLAAVVRVLPQEFPGIRCNLLGVPPGTAPDVGALAALLSAEHDGAVARIEGKTALVRDQHQAWPVWPLRPMRVGGCYVVTGGAGRVGSALAAGFSELVGCYVEVVGRRPATEVTAELAALRERGCRVGYSQLDVTDAGAVRALLDRLRAEWGRIGGVVHAAGMTDRTRFRPAADTDDESYFATRSAKVDGALALAAALRPDDADVILLCSSLSVVLGGVHFGAYVSANAWQDGFARERHEAGDTRWLSVEWDAWLPPGTTERPLAGPGRYALDDEDGHEVLRRLLLCAGPVVTVSTAALKDRSEQVRREIGAHVPVAEGLPVADGRDPGQMVRGLIADVLGSCPDDDTHDLRLDGVESLAILQIVGRLSSASGARVSMAEAMRNLSIAGLARLITGDRSGTSHAPSGLDVVAHPTGGRATYPSSSIQRRWLDLLPDGYGGIELLVDVLGAVVPEALRDAVSWTVEQHSGLRTVFLPSDGPAGGWVQAVRPAPEVPLIDLRGLPEPEQLRILTDAAITAAERWFDVGARPPFEVSVYALASDRHVLFVHAHHVLFDGWSSSIFLRDVARAARAEAISGGERVPLQYTDYALAQDDYLRTPAFEQEREHWRRVFNGAPPPTRLAARGGRTDDGRDRGELLPFLVPRALWAAIRTSSAAHGTTPFVVMMAAYGLAVHHYTGDLDLIIGTTAAGRPTPQTEEIVGVFVNPLPVRLRIEPGTTLAGYIGHVHGVLMDFHEHGNYPMEDLVASVPPFVGLGLNDTFHCYLLYQNYWRPNGLDLKFRPLPVEGAHHKLMRDWEIVLSETDNAELAGELWFRTERFSAGWAHDAAGRFVTMLEAMTRDGATPVAWLLPEQPDLTGGADSAH